MQKISILILLVFTLSYSNNSLAQKPPKYEQPIIVSSAGQSADVTLAGMILKKLKLDYKTVNLAKEADLEGMKTLIIVPGFSSKGLGAAGISREQELARVNSLLKSAKDKKLKIVMLHIGGKARRGSQSDEFNKIASEASSYMIVVKQGDEDKLFSNISKDKKIHIELVGKIAETMKPLSKLFNE